VGLGLRRISMSPRQIPEVKTWIREASAADLAELAVGCMEHSTAAEVQRHMDGFFECSLPSRVSASGA